MWGGAEGDPLGGSGAGRLAQARGDAVPRGDFGCLSGGPCVTGSRALERLVLDDSTSHGHQSLASEVWAFVFKHFFYLTDRDHQ